MKQEIILPYVLDVETITYQTQAFPLGMIKANITEYDTWLCNKFIDYYYHTGVGRFSIYDTDTWGYKEGMTIFHSLDVKKENFKNDLADVIMHNKKMLENGHYIFGMYNEFYIPGKKAYQKYDFAHGYMIFGYDDVKQVFHSAGYLADGHYQYFDIGFADYYKSIINCEYSKWFLYDYEINKAFQPHVDIRHIKKGIEEYLTGGQDNIHIYGSRVMDIFRQYVMNIGPKRLDLRYGRMYMEHKAIMYMRLQYLHQNKYANLSSICERYYSEVLQRAGNVFYVFMKYNITRKENLISLLEEQISAANTSEKDILQRVIEVFPVNLY